jgi:hypothetical protein
MITAIVMYLGVLAFLAMIFTVLEVPLTFRDVAIYTFFFALAYLALL